ncbi:TIGR03085 family metal-binding protein [Aquipuribacter nitratireducens]|uniref:TIGR03085 family metal-binding protein n=1 Tax=Aquipuribacter nitratireducens TaxID=650104 RepID=A0ABW0GT45_9MICO
MVTNVVSAVRTDLIEPLAALRATTQQEREALCDSLLSAGAHAPTLCEGWDVLGLAAHLVVRERRPDLAVGLVVPPLSGLLERARVAETRRGLDEVVARFRSGPPPWSPFALPGVDVVANLAELVVHHEDVRRAQGLGPREDVEDLQDTVWRYLPGATALTLLGSSLGVVALRPDGRRTVLRRGAHPVVLTGEPIDLLLRLFGRRAAQVDVGGPSLSVQRFERARLGV